MAELAGPGEALPLPRLTESTALVSAAKGTSILLAGKLFTYVARLVMTVLVSRLLGADQYGLYSMSLTAATVAGSIGVLGLDTTLVRYIARYRGRRDQAGLWGTLQMGAFAALTGLSCGVVLFLTSGYLAVNVFHDPRLAPLFRISSIMVPFLTLIALLAAATQGFRNMRYTAIAQQFSQPMLRMMLLVGIALTIGLTPGLATVAYVISTIAVTVLLFYFLNKQFSLRRRWRDGRRDTREIVAFSFPVYVSSLIRNFESHIQTLVLGVTHNVRSVGIYSVAAHFNLVGQVFHTSITSASMPIISELYDRRQWPELSRYYQVTTKWSFALNLPLFLIVLLFPVPVLSLFGKGFTEGASVLVILAWVNLIYTGTGLGGAIIDMTGHSRLKLANTIVLVGTSLALNLLLVPRYGMYGAAWAALVGSLIINLARLIEVYVLFGLLPYNREILKPGAAGAGGAAISWAVYQAAAPLGLYVAFAAATLGLAAAYLALILLFGLAPDDRLVLNRFRRRLTTSRKKSRGDT